MVELFVNPKIDWIAAKKYFIGLTIVLLIAGAISVQFRKFNLGVDFTGGTIMTVRFNQPHDAEEVRRALQQGGIDTSKVIIVNDKNNPRDMIIRAPELGSEAEVRVDETKRLIIRALQKLNPSGNEALGKLNINTTDADGIEQELRQTDPLGIDKKSFGGANPYAQIAAAVIAFRDYQSKGFIQDMSQIQGVPLTLKDIDPAEANFDPGKIQASLMSSFYAGKVDLNLAGSSEIEDALDRIDPLKIGGQGQEQYKKA